MDTCSKTEIVADNLLIISAATCRVFVTNIRNKSPESHKNMCEAPKLN